MSIELCSLDSIPRLDLLNSRLAPGVLQGSHPLRCGKERASSQRDPRA